MDSHSWCIWTGHTLYFCCADTSIDHIENTPSYFFADTQTWIIPSRCPYKTVNSIKHKCVCHGMIGEECFGFGHCVDHAICQSRDDDLGIACQDGHSLYYNNCAPCKVHTHNHAIYLDDIVFFFMRSQESNLAYVIYCALSQQILIKSIANVQRWCWHHFWASVRQSGCQQQLLQSRTNFYIKINSLIVTQLQVHCTKIYVTTSLVIGCRALCG